jgi:hypothetical protein
MGGSNSAEQSYDDKIFGPNGTLMEVSDMLKIQENLEGNYPKLSYVTEQEKKVLMPKLRKVYDLIDAWRSDVDLQYRHALNRMKAAADLFFYKQPRPVSTLLKGLIRWLVHIHYNPKAITKTEYSTLILNKRESVVAACKIR